MREVVVTVDADGKTLIGVNGVVGKSCLELTRDLERSLGTVASRAEKPEMHRQEGGQHAAQRPGRG